MMLLSALIKKIQENHYQVRARCTDPDVTISGIQYYADQAALEDDILYISFEDELPVHPSNICFTLLVLTTARVDINRNCPTNLLHFNEPSDYTVLINLISSILASNYKLTETICKITRSYFHKQSIQEVFNNAYILFENPLLLIDSNNKVIAQVPKKDKVSSPVPHTKYLQQLHDLQQKLKPPMTPVYLPHPTEQYHMLASNIIVNGYIIGTLLLMEQNHAFTENDTSGLQTLIYITTQMLADNLLYSQTQGHMSALLLDDVLSTPNYPPIMLERQLAALGYKNCRKLRFVAATFAASPSFSVFEELTAAIRKLFPDELYTMHEEQIVLLLINHSANLEKNVLSNLQLLNEKYHLLIGLSNSFTDLSETYRHYQQALVAHSYCGKITDAASQYYIFYDYIAQLELLKIVTKACNILDYCSPDILSLLKYDEQYQTDFSQTLSVYLNCFGDAVLASQKLKIHKNTLYYRLGIIKDIVNNDLSDGETNYLYMFSFRALQYLGRFHPVDI